MTDDPTKPDPRTPTKPGWYRARWWTPDHNSPTKSGCVFVDEMATGEMMVLGPLTNTWNPLSIIDWWGENIDDALAERDRLREELSESRSMTDAVRVEADRLRILAGTYGDGLADIQRALTEAGVDPSVEGIAELVALRRDAQMALREATRPDPLQDKLDDLTRRVIDGAEAHEARIRADERARIVKAFRHRAEEVGEGHAMSEVEEALTVERLAVLRSLDFAASWLDFHMADPEPAPRTEPGCPETSGHGVHACIRVAGHEGPCVWDFQVELLAARTEPAADERMIAALAAARELVRWDWLHLLDESAHSDDVRTAVNDLDNALASLDVEPSAPRSTGKPTEC